MCVHQPATNQIFTRTKKKKKDKKQQQLQPCQQLVHIVSIPRIPRWTVACLRTFRDIAAAGGGIRPCSFAPKEKPKRTEEQEEEEEDTDCEAPASFTHSSPGARERNLTVSAAERTGAAAVTAPWTHIHGARWSQTSSIVRTRVSPRGSTPVSLSLLPKQQQQKPARRCAPLHILLPACVCV